MVISVVVRWDGYAANSMGAAREGSPHPNAIKTFFVPCHLSRRLLIVVTNAAGVVERPRNHAHSGCHASRRGTMMERRLRALLAAASIAVAAPSSVHAQEEGIPVDRARYANRALLPDF